LGILEHLGRKAISQNAVPESIIRAVIGSANTSAFFVTNLPTDTNLPEKMSFLQVGIP
jgi:hypothetical protein